MGLEQGKYRRYQGACRLDSDAKDGCLALSFRQRISALDGMGDLFLGRSFLLQVFLFSTTFFLIVEHVFGFLFWTVC